MQMAWRTHRTRSDTIWLWNWFEWEGRNFFSVDETGQGAAGEAPKNNNKHFYLLHWLFTHFNRKGSSRASIKQEKQRKTKNSHLRCFYMFCIFWKSRKGLHLMAGKLKQPNKQPPGRVWCVFFLVWFFFWVFMLFLQLVWRQKLLIKQYTIRCGRPGNNNRTESIFFAGGFHPHSPPTGPPPTSSKSVLHFAPFFFVFVFLSWLFLVFGFLDQNGFFGPAGGSRAGNTLRLMSRAFLGGVRLQSRIEPTILISLPIPTGRVTSGGLATTSRLSPWQVSIFFLLAISCELRLVEVPKSSADSLSGPAVIRKGIFFSRILGNFVGTVFVAFSYKKYESESGG